MKKIILRPTKDDLHIGGRELLKIEIHFSSFSVFYQKKIAFAVEESIDIHEDIFPICFLKKFFVINGESKYFVPSLQIAICGRRRSMKKLFLKLPVAKNLLDFFFKIRTACIYYRDCVIMFNFENLYFKKSL